MRLMTQTDQQLRNISDTARWVAVYRAQETLRPDAVFRDPFAAKLAGERGREIAREMTFSQKHEWSFVTRTYLIDQFITEQVLDGVEMVVNLAAGLDARPYRMSLPETLEWVEVDLPELLDYKEEILKDDKPVCPLEHIRLDLANVDARRALFAQLSARAKKILILTEGLLIYLSPEEVAALAQDLAAPASFQRWVFDLVSPGLLKMLQGGMNAQLSKANAPLRFGPEDSVDFFRPHGWGNADVRSLLKTAGKLGRLNWKMRLISFLPEPPRPGPRPWSGICLLQRV